MPRLKILLAALILLPAALAPAVALAQGSFLDRGRDMLKGLGGGSEGTSGGSAAGLGTDEIARGLREALRVGSERVVSTLGARDGFNKNPEIHIPLPPALKSVQGALSRVGMSGLADDLELRLNRAAEEAVPRAKPIFLKAIEEMTLDDVKGILDGPKDAATQYFRGKMSGPLAEEMKPVVNSSLSEVGAVQTYDRMIGQYKQIPFMPDAKADLTSYVLDKSIGAVFTYLGREEAAIRENPARRTTDILKTVFGGG